MSASQANKSSTAKALPSDWDDKKKGAKGRAKADVECSKGGDDADDDEGDDDDEDDDMDKSRTSVDDLKKALAGMAAHIEAHDPVDRKQSLLTKAQAGETLNKSEKAELFALIEGNSPAKEDASQPLSKSFSENETLQKGFDVSDFLSELSDSLCKAQDALTERVAKSQASQNDFNLSLAKAVAHSGRVTLEAMDLIKSIADRVGAIEAQPARGPRSTTVGRPLEKSFGGQQATGGGQQLNKSQTLGVLTAMHEQSIREGREGMSKSGQDNLNVAITKYETTNSMSKSLEAEVIEFIRDTKQATNRAH